MKFKMTLDTTNVNQAVIQEVEKQYEIFRIFLQTTCKSSHL